MQPLVKDLAVVLSGVVVLTQRLAAAVAAVPYMVTILSFPYWVVLEEAGLMLLARLPVQAVEEVEQSWSQHLVKLL